MVMMYMKNTNYTTMKKKMTVFKKLFKIKIIYINNVSLNSRHPRISL